MKTVLCPACGAYWQCNCVGVLGLPLWPMESLAENPDNLEAIDAIWNHIALDPSDNKSAENVNQ